MSQKRVIKCDIPNCPYYREEVEYGGGWEGWGQIQGVALNGKANPDLCPEHLKQTMNFVDKLR